MHDLMQNLRMLHAVAPDLQAVVQSLIDAPQVLQRGLKAHTKIFATGCQRQQRRVQMSWGSRECKRSTSAPEPRGPKGTSWSTYCP